LGLGHPEDSGRLLDLGVEEFFELLLGKAEYRPIFRFYGNVGDVVDGREQAKMRVSVHAGGEKKGNYVIHPFDLHVKTTHGSAELVKQVGPLQIIDQRGVVFVYEHGEPATGGEGAGDC
jgi:hypothetical protein